MRHKNHTHTVIEHHDDGSHTMHRHHSDGTKHSSAHHNLDGVHDALQDHLGEVNPGEAAANQGDHGVLEPQASAAALPPGAPGAAA